MQISRNIPCLVWEMYESAFVRLSGGCSSVCQADSSRLQEFAHFTHVHDLGMISGKMSISSMLLLRRHLAIALEQYSRQEFCLQSNSVIFWSSFTSYFWISTWVKSVIFITQLSLDFRFFPGIFYLFYFCRQK